MHKPFTDPGTPHQRRHGPQGYAQLDGFRPWLRDEFDFRCIYCLFREQWGRVRGNFDLDHFHPVASYSERALAYDNLLYCCATCNTAKGAQTVPNPELVLLATDVWVKDDGSLAARTPAARRLIKVLGLDDPEYTEFRLLWLGIAALASRYDPPLLQKLMGYPGDLPDLARFRPPGGNTRPEGINHSHYARKHQGVLPLTY
jgi:hypothetical protein